jgi:hypothetical protein
MIYFSENQFWCPTCKGHLTIYSENGGKGFRARCKTCKITYYYPACELCNQGTWRHDEEKCQAAQAEKVGLRYCRKCKLKKNPAEFNMNGVSVSARCKTCQAEYFKHWHESRTVKTLESSSNEDVLNELFGDE